MTPNSKPSSEGLPTGSVCDPGAPVIVFGAGRSGSTLLMRLLRAHPAISMKAEPSFLLPRVWETLWEQPLWYQNLIPKKIGHRARSFHEARQKTVAELPVEERDRIGAATGSFLAAIMKVDPACRYWGFKEIWNGSSACRYPWDTYDLAFPRATWINIVRHPLDFLGSYMSWHSCDLSFPFLQARLADWVSMVHHSRERASTGRYFVVRFEDLKKMPRETLQPTFDRLGIEWCEECDAVMKIKTLNSRRDRAAEELLFRRLSITPELVKAAALHDYTFERHSGSTMSVASSGRATADERPRPPRITLLDRLRFSAVAGYLLLVFWMVVLSSFRVVVKLARKRFAPAPKPDLADEKAILVRIGPPDESEEAPRAVA